MNKTKALFVLLSLIFVFVSNLSANTAFADDTERKRINLSKSTFEEGEFEGWSPLGNSATLSIETKYTHNGSYSLKTYERYESWSGPSINITEFMTPASPFYIEGFVLCETGMSGNIRMTLKYTDTEGNDEYVLVDSNDNVGASQWIKLSGKVLLPQNAADAIVYFESESADTEFYIDDISFYVYDTEAEAEIAETTEKKSEAEYNFEFEDGIDGWIPRGNLSVELTERFYYKGKSALLASKREKIWNSPSVRLKNIQPGVNYRYSAYVMYNGKDYEDSHTFLIELQYIYEGRENYSVIAEKEIMKGTWSNITGNFTLPKGATDVYFYIQTADIEEGEEISPSDLMDFYVDNVNIINNSVNTRQRVIYIAILIVSAVFVFVILASVVRVISGKVKNTSSALRSAATDTMTGALNRNAYEEKMSILEASPEKCRKIFITECDVNFLKYINDNYGHEVGDKAIIRCAEIIIRVIGKKGEVYRTGGDEFVCITSVDFTEKLREEFEKESGKDEGYPFSAAVGTAHYDSENDWQPNIKTILARCDKEMYKNKQHIKEEHKDLK